VLRSAIPSAESPPGSGTGTSLVVVVVVVVVVVLAGVKGVLPGVFVAAEVRARSRSRSLSSASCWRWRIRTCSLSSRSCCSRSQDFLELSLCISLSGARGGEGGGFGDWLGLDSGE